MKPQQQRTLLNLSKVVRLDASQVCFTATDIAALRTTLLDERSSRHDLLCALRKLDCYRLELADLASSGVGGAVATLTAHPRPDVARFAAALLDKLRSVADRALFSRLPYDVDAAAAAPEGRAQTPQEAAQLAALAVRAERRRRQMEAEADFLDDSSEDEREEGSTGDDDWRPSAGSCRAAVTAAAASAAAPATTLVPGSVTAHPLAARFAPDSAFRRTRAGSRVPQGVEPGSDGRMYRQATLAAAFTGGGQRTGASLAGLQSRKPTLPAAAGGAGTMMEDDLPVAGQGAVVVEEDLALVGGAIVVEENLVVSSTRRLPPGEPGGIEDETMAIEIM